MSVFECLPWHYANGPVAWVLTVVVGGSVVGVAVVGVAVVGVAVVHSRKPRLVSCPDPTQRVGSGYETKPRPALKNGHTISLSPRNVYVATLFKLLGWAGRPAPCALYVSDQSGRI